MEGPTLPELGNWTCPRGWQSAPSWNSHAGVAPAVAARLSFRTCRPPELPRVCPPGTMPVLGHSQCVRQGLTCPKDGPWHDEATIRSRAPGFEGRVLYISPTAPKEGTGTRAEPFASIEGAMDWSEDGDILALGTGTYETMVFVFDHLALVGACEANTLVTRELTDDVEAVLNIDVIGPVTLSDFRISGASRGIRVLASELLRITSVRLHRTTETALWISPTEPEVEVFLEDVVISETQLDPEGEFGIAIEINSGGSVTLYRTLIDQSRRGGIYLDGERSALRMVESAITRTRAPAEPELTGWGLLVVDGARAELDRVWLDRNEDVSMYVDGDGSELILTDVLVTGTRSGAGAAAVAHGISLHNGARAEFERVLLDSNRGIGLFVSDPDTSLRLSEAAVLNTQPAPGTPESGRGLQARAGARVELSRGLFDHNHDVAVLATGPGTLLQGHDLAISNTQPAANGSGRGRGLEVSDGARGEIQRSLIRASHQVGFAVLGPASEGVARELRVRKTYASPCPNETCRSPGGTGVVVSNGAAIELDDFSITESALAGLQLADSRELRITRGLLTHNAIALNAPAEASATLKSQIGNHNLREIETRTLPVPRATRDQ